MKRKDRQAFLFSMGVTLFALILSLGAVTVDQRGRQLSFGDETPAFRTVDEPGGETVLEIRLFGGEKDVNVTKIDKLWNFLLDFGCIPHS